MEDRNSPEAMAARAAQPDPIVMYLIVKESLGMSMGKTAAQCAHGSQMLQLKFNKLLNEITATEFGKEPNWAEEFPEYFIFSEWLNTSFRKVVLRANDHQFERLKIECPNHIVVVDAGITEIAAGSETVLGIWPMHRSKCPKYLTKIQVLK
jgi:peptidyl-tRNA hydrolase